jgi:hypothetical protein
MLSLWETKCDKESAFTVAAARFISPAILAFAYYKQCKLRLNDNLQSLCEYLKCLTRFSWYHTETVLTTAQFMWYFWRTSTRWVGSTTVCRLMVVYRTEHRIFQSEANMRILQADRNRPSSEISLFRDLQGVQGKRDWYGWLQYKGSVARNFWVYVDEGVNDKLWYMGDAVEFVGWKASILSVFRKPGSNKKV